MGDRAQYFLEQSIPELLDLQEKKIFTPLEIKAITRKRTTFEHALTRKIVRKADFLRYAEYEINLEALRVQRVKRLQIKGKKSISDWAGPRRIFFIFERATKRFHGDVELWLQYIDYAKQEKSNKILGKAYTALLQYHPTNAAMWNLAAEHEMNWNGNMTAARSLMQRGLRLNTGSRQLWLDYFKLELTYLSKIYARRRVLGIDKGPAEPEEETTITGLEDGMSNTIKLPSVAKGENDIDKAQDALLKDVALSTLSTSTDNPALQGAIPRAIINSAAKSMHEDVNLIMGFYDVMASFTDLPFQESFLENIVAMLSETAIKGHPKACFVRAILPLSMLKYDVRDPMFPAAFKQALLNYSRAAKDTSSLVMLVEHWNNFLITKLLAVPHLDKHLRKAIKLTVRSAFKSVEPTVALYKTWIKFEEDDERRDDAAAILQQAESKYERFQQM